MNRPVVLKPRYGQKGLGVSVNLTSEIDIRAAFKSASEFGEVVVEEQINGIAEFRCLASPRECISVVRRILPWIEGDGQSTIKELIVKKNAHRQLNPSTHGRSIPVNEVTERFLSSNGLSLNHVPAQGCRLRIRDVGGLSSGGEPHECFETIDAAVKETATAAVAAIPGLGWGGADVMLDESGVAYLIEINSDADISGSRFPYYGVPKAVDDYLYGVRLRDSALPPISKMEETEQPSPAHVGPTSIGGKRLGELLLDYLGSEGWAIENVSSRVHLATSQTGEQAWLIGCATTHDLEIVQRIASEHGTVRQLLRVNGVAVPRARNVQSTNQLQEFLQHIQEDARLVPFRGSWNSAKATMYHKATTNRPAKLFSSKTKWVLQSHPKGDRFIVLSTATEGLAISGTTAPPEDLKQELIEMAKSATESVPGLRWGAWAIVVRRNKPLLVEGLHNDPLFEQGEAILHGDLLHVWKVILASTK